VTSLSTAFFECEPDDLAFEVLWKALHTYYGPVLPPVSLFEGQQGVVTQQSKKRLTLWKKSMTDTGRVVAHPFLTPIDVIFLEIPHLQHFDLMRLSNEEIELFLRHASPEVDDIQLSQELHHWFFLPLLATLKQHTISVEDFPLHVTFVSASGTPTTADLARFLQTIPAAFSPKEPLPDPEEPEHD
jgi:hypothetical protein